MPRHKMRKYNISGQIYASTVHYSPDDGGWYGEMFNIDTHDIFHTNKVTDTATEAWEEVREFRVTIFQKGDRRG